MTSVFSAESALEWYVSLDGGLIVNRFAVLLFGAALTIPLPTLADDAIKDRVKSCVDDFGFDCLKLWNNCDFVFFDVFLHEGDARRGLHKDKILGLEKDVIETLVRSKFQDAGLFQSDDELRAYSSPYFIVRLEDHKSILSISFEFKKIVADVTIGPIVTGPATTWELRGTGNHGGNAGRVLSAVLDGVGKFIEEYLFVNHNACRTR